MDRPELLDVRRNLNHGDAADTRRGKSPEMATLMHTSIRSESAVVGGDLDGNGRAKCEV